MVSTKTLVKIAIGGGWVTIGSAIFFKYKIAKNWREQAFHQKSMSVLDGYPPAAEILGKPFTLPILEHGDRRLNYTDGLTARIAIPLNGRKGKGILHSWSSRKDTSDDWRVDKCDLEVKSKGTRWTFYIHPDSQDRFSVTTKHSSTDTDSKEEPSTTVNTPIAKPTTEEAQTEIPPELEYISKT